MLAQSLRVLESSSLAGELSNDKMFFKNKWLYAIISAKDGVVTMSIRNLFKPLETVLNAFCKSSSYEWAKFRSINAAASLKPGLYPFECSFCCEIPQH